MKIKKIALMLSVILSINIIASSGVFNEVTLLEDYLESQTEYENESDTDVVESEDVEDEYLIDDDVELLEGYTEMTEEEIAEWNESATPAEAFTFVDGVITDYDFEKDPKYWETYEGVKLQIDAMQAEVEAYNITPEEAYENAVAEEVSQAEALSEGEQALSSFRNYESVTEEPIFEPVMTSAEITIVSSEDTPTELGVVNYVKIPATINGIEVTGVAEEAFKWKNIATLEIPNTVTYIGESAFADNILTSVVFSKNLEVIDNKAFFSNDLTEVILPEGLLQIGDEAFGKNRMLSIDIPESVEILGDKILEGSVVNISQYVTVSEATTLMTARKYDFDFDKLLTDNGHKRKELNNLELNATSGAEVSQGISTWSLTVPDAIDTEEDEFLSVSYEISNENTSADTGSVMLMSATTISSDASVYPTTVMPTYTDTEETTFYLCDVCGDKYESNQTTYRTFNPIPGLRDTSTTYIITSKSYYYKHSWYEDDEGVGCSVRSNGYTSDYYHPGISVTPNGSSGNYDDILGTVGDEFGNVYILSRRYSSSGLGGTSIQQSSFYTYSLACTSWNTPGAITCVSIGGVMFFFRGLSSYSWSVGWSHNSNNNTEITNRYGPGNGVLSATAYWSTVNLELHANPGDGSTTVLKDGVAFTYSTEEVTSGAELDMLPTLTRQGYDFVGWYNTSASSGGTLYTSTSTINNDLSLYARWTPKTITLSFSGNKGTGSTTATSVPSSKDVTFDSALGTLSTPSRAGYTFAGWWSTSSTSGGTRYYSTTISTFTSNTTIYARWTAINYTLTLHANDGTGDFSTQTVAFDTYMTWLDNAEENGVLHPDDVKRRGMLFDGWYTNADVVNRGTLYNSSSRYTTVGNLDLYAQYTNSHEIIYIYNDEKTANKIVVTRTNTPAPEPTKPTRSGYVFMGWSLVDGGRNDIWDFDTPIIADLVLYGVWAVERFITLDYNRYTGDTQVVSHADGEKFTEPEIPARTGYDGLGWYEVVDGVRLDEPFDFTQTIVRDTYLQVKWIGVRTITFNTQSGTPSNYTVSVRDEDKIPVQEDPVRTNYIFGGWYTGAYATGTKWDFENDIVNGSSFTLYAYWIPAVTITYVSEYGTVQPPYTIIPQGESIWSYNDSWEPSIVDDGTIPEGYAITGWYTDSGENWTWDKPVTSSMTLTAKWDIERTITYNLNGGYFSADDSVIKPPTKVGNNYYLDLELYEYPEHSTLYFGGWYEDANYQTRWSDTDRLITKDTIIYALFGEKVTVSFATNGGTTIEPITMIAGQKFYEDEMPTTTRDGWNFAGWYLDGMFGTRLQYGVYQVMSNITLYADWKTECMVTFDTQGGSPQPDAQYVSSGDYATYPQPVPTLNGLYVSGWYTDKTYATEWNFYTDKVTKNTTLYAYYDEGVTVTFDGGIYATPRYQTVTIGKGSLLPKPETPVHSQGLGLVDWMKPITNEYWSFPTDRVYADMTLTADWAATVTVKFNTNGGTPLVADRQIALGALVAEPIIYKDYMIIDYWITDYGKVWDYATDRVTQAMTLNAIWVDAVTVTFNTDGADTETPDAQYIAKGTKVTNPGDPTRGSDTFLGWYATGETTAWDFETRTADKNTQLTAYWYETRTITFDTDGGTVALNGGTTVDIDPLYINLGWTVSSMESAYPSVVFPANPEKYMHDFVGWKIVSNDLYNGTMFSKDTNAILNDYHLVAQYIPIYTVTYDSNGGSGVPSEKVLRDGFAIEPEEPIHQTQAFAGWYTGLDFETEWEFNTMQVRSNMTLYAKWEDPIYVKFTVISTPPVVVATQKIAYGKTITVPETPVHPTDSELAFDGWYTTTNFDADSWFDPTTPIFEDVTLYGRFVEGASVVFITPDGATPVATQVVQLGDYAIRPNPSPTMSGDAFKYWTITEADNNNPFDFENTPITETTILYSQWAGSEAGIAIVHYETYEATNAVLFPSQIFAIGGLIDEPTIIPIRGDDTFSGWYKNPECTVRWNFTEDRITTNPTTIYAGYANGVTVEYYSNLDGEYTKVDSEIIPEGTLAVDKPMQNTETHFFMGWYDNKLDHSGDAWDFETPVYGTNDNDGDDDKLLLYSKWKQAWVMTFDLNGGVDTDAEGNELYPDRIIEDGQFTELPEIPTHEDNYGFVNWYVKETEEDGTVTYKEWFDFQETVIERSYDLIAVWDTNIVTPPSSVYTINFVMNGGTPVAETQYRGVGAYLTVPENPTKDGYYFSGWYQETSLTNKWDYKADTVQGDMTLYAGFVKQSEVRFHYNGDDLDQGTVTIFADIGNKIDRPQPDPTKTVGGVKHELRGWWTNPSFTGEQWNFLVDTVSTTELDLYARYTSSEDQIITVSYVYGDGRTPDPVVIKTGLDAYLVEPEDKTHTTDSDLIIEGWYTGQNGTGSKWDFTYSQVTSDITLYANWQKGYVVSFNLNYGYQPTTSTVYVTCEDQIVTYGSLVERPDPNPVKGTQAYIMWTYNGVEWDFFRDTVKSNMTLVAVYTDAGVEEQKALVQYDTDGGIPPIPDEIIGIGALLIEPKQTLTREAGESLVGWFTEPDGQGTKWIFSDHRVQGDMTLYAYWADTIAVHFDSNGGSEVKTQYVAYGNFATEPTGVQCPTGKAIEGWYTDNGTFTEKWIFASRPVYQEVTLYANMVDLVKVTFHPQNGDDSYVVEVAKGLPVAKPDPDPKNSPYDLVGWYTESKGFDPENVLSADKYLEDLWYFDTPVIEDMDLYAEYGRTQSVTYDYNYLSSTKTVTVKVGYGSVATEPTDAFQVGYLVEGWYEVVSGVQSTTKWDFKTNQILKDTILRAEWEEAVTVTFNTRSNAYIPSIEIVKGSALVEAEMPIPVRESGIEFLGWYKESNLVNAWDYDNDTVDEDITLYAKWSDDTTITFVTNTEDLMNGYDVPQYDAIVVTQGKTITNAPKDPADQEYADRSLMFRFDGWYKDELFLEEFNFLSDVTEEGVTELTLYARWVRQYLVTFDTRGGSDVDEQKVDINSVAVRPSQIPTRTDDATVTFVDWYADEYLDAEFNFSGTKITEDTVVYARWSDDVVIKFESNGGTYINNQIIKPQTTATKPNPNPEKEVDGVLYEFEAWYATNDLKVADLWNFDTLISNDKTLYASWDRVWNVTFDANGGSQTPETQQVIHMRKAEYPTTPTYEGYGLVGWYTDGGAGELWNFKENAVTEHIELTAVWSEVTYTVTFDVDGGTPEPASVTVGSGGTVNEPTEPTKTSNRFAGWYNGDDKWDFYNDTVTSNITLKALWTTIPVTVSFWDTVTDSLMFTQTIGLGGTVSRPDPDPTKEAYYFVDWYTTPSPDVEWDFQNTKLVSNTTIYAHWIERDEEPPVATTYKVEFDSMGGTLVETEYVVVDGYSIHSGPSYEPTKVGFTFDGWFKDSSLQSKWYYNYDTVTKDTVLYAGWMTNNGTDTYRVVYDSRNGDEPISILVKVGEGFTAPVNPVKSGDVFDAWYTGENFDSGSAWVFGTPAYEDMILYAKWKSDTDETPKTETFNVTLDANGGTFTVSGVTSQTIVEKVPNEGVVLTPSGERLPKNGVEELVGWYLDKDFETEFTFEKDLITKDTTIYAKWTSDREDLDGKLQLIFDLRNGEAITEYRLNYGDIIYSKYAPETGDGFEGWFTAGTINNPTASPYTFGQTMTTSLILYARWAGEGNGEPAVHTVTFDARNGNYFDNWSVLVPDQGVMVQPTKVPTKTLADGTADVFIGWFTGEAFDGDVTYSFETTQVTKSFVLYAKWESDVTPETEPPQTETPVYDVTFDTQGETPKPQDQKVPENGIVQKPSSDEEPTRVGDEFEGWYKESAFVNEWTFARDTVVKDTTIYAMFDSDIDKTYTVTYDARGGLPQPEYVIVKEDEVLTKPATNPSRTINGVDDPFIGWFTGEGFEGTTSYVFGLEVKENFTLYAKYESDTTEEDGGGEPTPEGTVYDVIFDGRGGTPEVQVLKVPNGGVVTNLVDGQNTIPKDPYKEILDETTNQMVEDPFLGWYTSTDFYNASNKFDFSTIVEGDMIIYAKYESDTTGSGGGGTQTPEGTKYDVTFDANGGAPTPATQSVPNNGLVLEPKDVTKEIDGIVETPAGWYTELTFDNQWFFMESRIEDKAITLYAAWSTDSKDINITYQTEDGSVSEDVKAVLGQALGEYKPTNAVFAGVTVWEDENGNLYTENSIVTESLKDAILTPYDSSNGDVVQVIYDLRLGTASDVTVHNVTVGSALPNPPTVPSVVDKTFDKWYINDGESVRELDYDKDGIVTKSVIIYAVWSDEDVESEKATVYFDTQGGSPTVANQTVLVGGLILEPTEKPVKDGETIVGWYTKSVDGVKWNFLSDKVESDMYLYAIYPSDLDTITITFEAPNGVTEDVEATLYLPLSDSLPTDEAFKDVDYWTDKVTGEIILNTDTVTEDLADKTLVGQVLGSNEIVIEFVAKDGTTERKVATIGVALSTVDPTNAPFGTVDAWTTKASGNGRAYLRSDLVTEDMTVLYAYFDGDKGGDPDKEFILTFEAPDGTIERVVATVDTPLGDNLPSDEAFDNVDVWVDKDTGDVYTNDDTVTEEFEGKTLVGTELENGEFLIEFIAQDGTSAKRIAKAGVALSTVDPTEAPFGTVDAWTTEAQGYGRAYLRSDLVTESMTVLYAYNYGDKGPSIDPDDEVILTFKAPDGTIERVVAVVDTPLGDNLPSDEAFDDVDVWKDEDTGDIYTNDDTVTKEFEDKILVGTILGDDDVVITFVAKDGTRVNKLATKGQLLSEVDPTEAPFGTVDAWTTKASGEGRVYLRSDKVTEEMTVLYAYFDGDKGGDPDNEFILTYEAPDGTIERVVATIDTPLGDNLPSDEAFDDVDVWMDKDTGDIYTNDDIVTEEFEDKILVGVELASNQVVITYETKDALVRENVIATIGTRLSLNLPVNVAFDGVEEWYVKGNDSVTYLNTNNVVSAMNGVTLIPVSDDDDTEVTVEVTFTVGSDSKTVDAVVDTELGENVPTESPFAEIEIWIDADDGTVYINSDIVDETYEGKEFIGYELGANEVLITYVSKDGTVTEHVIATINTPISNNLPENVVFDGVTDWKDTDGAEYVNSDMVDVSFNFKVLTPYDKEAETIDVTFSTRGGTPIPDVQTIEVGSVATAPALPTNSLLGGQATGWYLGEDFAEGDKFDFSTALYVNTTLYAKYPDDTNTEVYTVTFDARGGSPDTVYKVPKGGTVSVPVTPTKQLENGTYDEFLGWFNGSDFIVARPFNFDTQITATIVVYAKWQSDIDEDGYPEEPDGEVFDVTFDARGGLPVPSKQEVPYNGLVAKPDIDPSKTVTFTADSDEFIGWFTDDVTFETEWNFSTMRIDGETTLYAKYDSDVTKVTVTYNSNGGTPVMSSTIEKGDVLVKPTSPTKDKHTFALWYSDAELVTLWTWGSTVEEDMTLHANWTPDADANEHTVSFDVGTKGNPTPVSSFTVAHGYNFYPPADPTRDDGETFVGWYTSATYEAETRWSFASDATNVVTEDMTLYAGWTDSNIPTGYVTVKFVTYGGTPEPADQILELGSTVDKPTLPTKDEYGFRGWFYTNTQTGVQTEWDFIYGQVYDDMTLYAQWLQPIVNVTFEPRNGKASTTFAYAEGALIDELSPTPINGLNRFDGWYTELTMQPESQWNFFTDRLSSEDVTLYARWSNDVVVTFVTATDQTIDPQIIQTGDKVIEPDTVLYKGEGWTHTGWYSDSLLTELYDFDTVMADKQADIVLTAGWIYTGELAIISFDTRGGSYIAPVQITPGYAMDSYRIPADPAREDYNFLGWYTDMNYSSGTLVDLLTHVFNEDTTVYAKWELKADKTNEDEVEIRFDTRIEGLEVGSFFVKVGETFAKPVDPVYEGLGFMGWHTDTTWSNPWTFESDVATEADIAEGKTLYARWSNDYIGDMTVTFDARNGTMPYIVKVSFGHTLNPQVEPVKTGDEFLGWYTSTEFLVDQLWDFDTEVKRDMTLYAKWKVEDGDGETPPSDLVTVTFNARNDSTPMTAQYKVGALVEEPNTPVYGNEGFLGWYEDENVWEKAWNFNVQRVEGEMTLYAKWTSDGTTNNFWTVVYEPNNGSSMLSAQVLKEPKQLAPDPGTPVKYDDEGNSLEFLGWYTTSTFYQTSKWNIKTDYVTSNVVLYARYEGDDEIIVSGASIVVLYQPNNGENTFTKVVSTGETVENVKVTKLLSDGTEDIFLGWYDGPDFETAKLWDHEEVIDVDAIEADLISLFARWQSDDDTELRHRVVFDALNGKLPYVTTVAHGESIAYIPTPEFPEGAMALAGWYTDTAYTDLWYTGRVVVEDVTLYAKWANVDTSTKYNVVFDSRIELENLEPGESGVTTLQVTSGAKLSKPTDPVNGEAEFMGWYISKDFTSADARVWNFEVDTVKSDITLYARWSTDAGADPEDLFYTVTLKLRNTSLDITVLTPQNQPMNQPQDPVNGTQEFLGWFTEISLEQNADETYVYAWNFENNVESNMTLYAMWSSDDVEEDAEITVTYELAGGNYLGVTTAVTVVVEAGVTFNQPADPVRVEIVDGVEHEFEFDGWYTRSYNQTLDYKWNFLTDTTNTSLILYAKWTYVGPDETKVAQIIFDHRGGYPDYYEYTAIIGSTIVLPSSYEPVKLNASFDGWNYNPNYGVVEKFDPTRLITGKTVLYAIWIEK